MKIRGKGHRDRHADRYELEKRSPRLPGNPESQHGVKRECENQERESDESPLLPDVPRNEVVVAEWKEPVLLPAAPEPDAENLTRADSDERLSKLVADFGRGGAR